MPHLTFLGGAYFQLTTCAVCLFVGPACKVVKKRGDILLTAKAYNGRVILEFLAHRLRQLVESQHEVGDQRIPVAAACATPCFNRNDNDQSLIIASIEALSSTPCHLRTRLARFYGLMERGPRFLSHGCMLVQLLDYEPNS